MLELNCGGIIMLDKKQIINLSSNHILYDPNGNVYVVNDNKTKVSTIDEFVDCSEGQTLCKLNDRYYLGSEKGPELKKCYAIIDTVSDLYSFEKELKFRMEQKNRSEELLDF